MKRKKPPKQVTKYILKKQQKKGCYKIYLVVLEGKLIVSKRFVAKNLPYKTAQEKIYKLNKKKK